MKRTTVGKYVLDQLGKEPESRDPVEIRQEIRRDATYLQNLEDCCSNFIQKHNHAGDFYVSVITTKEGVLFRKAYRDRFIARFSCPTPDYNITAWKYHAKKSFCEYLWTIGDRNTVVDMVRFPQFYSQISPELLRFALLFQSGVLLKQVKEMNGEFSVISSPYELMNKIPLVL